MPPKKILLAEDDADDQLFFLDFLQHRKDVSLLRAVENGEEVLHFLEEAGTDGGLPDLIILDQNMPKRNGLQTLKALKESSVYQTIPVLVYSTYTDDRLKKQSMEFGAALVHPKPFTTEGYHQMMNDFLSVVEKKN